MRHRIASILKRGLGTARDRLLRRHLERMKQLEKRVLFLERRLQRELPPELPRQLERHSESLRWLAVHGAREQPDPADLDGRALVSIVMPAFDAADTIAGAVESVQGQSYDHWELLVVDDGSGDATLERLEPFRDDRRVQVTRLEHRGVSRARNHALAGSRGEIIAYLDADNTWLPHHLAHVVAAFARHPEHECLYLAELVRRAAHRSWFVRGREFDAARLAEANYIDLNVFAHRRRLYEACGGFDEGLERLVDWDLIRRYARESEPLHVPQVGAVYEELRPHGVTATRGPARPTYAIQRKLQEPSSRGLRVLYALDEFPQRSESYMRWEMECMRRWGVEVEVWRSRDLVPASPYPHDFGVHDGSLAEAIRRFQPHVVHAHWLHVAVRVAAELGRTGRTMTVRGHSFEHIRSHVRPLIDSQAVEAVYVFPHFLEPGAEPKLRPLNVAINGALYHPEEKDRRLVARVAAGLPYKDLATYLQTAARCPELRFVLAVTKVHTHEPFLDELRAQNEALGSPVEILHDVPTEELAATIRRAGIYLHTNDPGAHRFGMPISIAEAMATGAHVIVRRGPESTRVLGDRAAFYSDVDEAVGHVRETLDWSDARWRQVETRNVEHALGRFGDVIVLRPLLDHWHEIAARRRFFFAPPAPAIDDHVAAFLEAHTPGRDVDRHNLATHSLAMAYGVMNAGLDERLWKAAALHSVYGTTRRTDMEEATPSPELREEAALHIGQDAERLVYLYCAMDAEEFRARAEAGEEVKEIRDRFTGARHALDTQDLADLCVLHLFDGLEKLSRGFGPARIPLHRALAQRLGGGALDTYRGLLGGRGSGLAPAPPPPGGRPGASRAGTPGRP